MNHDASETSGHSGACRPAETEQEEQCASGATGLAAHLQHAPQIIAPRIPAMRTLTSRRVFEQNEQRSFLGLSPLEGGSSVLTSASGSSSTVFTFGPNNARPDL